MFYSLYYFCFGWPGVLPPKPALARIRYCALYAILN